MKNGDKVNVMTIADAERVAMSLVDALNIGVAGIQSHGFIVELCNGKFEDGEFIETGSIDNIGIKVSPIVKIISKEFVEIQLGHPLQKLTAVEVINKLQEAINKLPVGIEIMGNFKGIITTRDQTSDDSHNEV